MVTITAPDGRVLSASEVTDSIEFQSDYRQSRVTRVYRMTPSDLGVSFAAGQVYSLRVVTPSGRVVSGSTTIPVSPLPVGDASRVDTVHVERDSILVNWILSPTARAYELAISFHDGNYPSALTIYRAFADSGFVMSARSRFLSSLILRNGIVNDIAVVAVDANYYDYYRRGSDLFGGTGIINHLNGGVGVFAAIGRVNHQRVFAIFPPAP